MALTEASVSPSARLPRNIPALLTCPENQIRLLDFCSSIPSSTRTDCESSDSIPLYAFSRDLISWRTVSRPDGSDFNRPFPSVVEQEQSSDFMRQPGEIAPPVPPGSEGRVFAVGLTGDTRAKVMAGALQQHSGRWEFVPRGFNDGCGMAYYTHKGKSVGTC